MAIKEYKDSATPLNLAPLMVQEGEIDLGSLENMRPGLRLKIVPRHSLTPIELASLSTYLGRNIQNVPDLISAARNVSTLSVNGVEITLEPRILNRLKSRCHPTEDWSEFLKRIVIEQLAGYCGA